MLRARPRTSTVDQHASRADIVGRSICRYVAMKTSTLVFSSTFFTAIKFVLKSSSVFYHALNIEWGPGVHEKAIFPQGYGTCDEEE